MKTVLLLIILLGTSKLGKTQTFALPDNIALATTADFTNAEPLVLKSIDWMLGSHSCKDTTKSKEINLFLMRWMIGSPAVQINIKEGVAPLDCPECLMNFICGWTKYSLLHNYSKDEIACAEAGAQYLIVFYLHHRATLPRNAEVENLLALQIQGKLRSYIAQKYND